MPKIFDEALRQPDGTKINTQPIEFDVSNLLRKKLRGIAESSFLRENDNLPMPRSLDRALRWRIVFRAGSCDSLVEPTWQEAAA